MNHLGRRLRVAMLSIAYVPYKTPSDKQFVHELMEALTGEVDLAMWSLNDEEENCRQFMLGEGTVLYHNRNRLFHKPAFSSKKGSYKPHPTHSDIRNGLEINSSLIHYLGDMRRFMDDFKPDILHFTDSAGPVAYLIKPAFSNIPMTITKPTMQISRGKKGLPYRYYVKKSLDIADKILTFTHAAQKELQYIGLPENQLDVIPWGIKLSDHKMSRDEILSFRKRYGCNAEELLVIVSDRMAYIPSELLDTANYLESLGEDQKIKFVITIRPTRFRAEYAHWVGKHVIIENGPDDFYNLLEAADLLLAPVGRTEINRSSLIPLTWMEAMQRGMPVISKRVPGAEDLIQEGKTGFLYDSAEEWPDLLRNFEDRQYLHSCQNDARKIIVKAFSMGIIAQKYASVWKELSVAK